MSLVFKAKLENIKVGDKTVTAPLLKLIMLALADHCNDDGEGAYPSIKKLERKTSLSHQSVLNTLEALRQNSMIIKNGMSRLGTVNYTVNIPFLTSLVHQIDYHEQYNTPDMGVSTPDVKGSKPGGKSSTPDIPYPSLTTIEPSFNNKQISIFEDHFRSFNGKRERERWETLLEAIGPARAEEIAAWAERKEIHMTNRGGLMDSLETAARKWTQPAVRKPKGDRSAEIEAVWRM